MLRKGTYLPGLLALKTIFTADWQLSPAASDNNPPFMGQWGEKENASN